MPSLLTLIGLRSTWRRILAAHPGETVFPTLVVSWPQSARGEGGKVVALIADSSGISLRDRRDDEVRLLPANEILSVELAPLTRSAFRPFRIATLQNGTLDLAMSQIRPDDQVDAIIALRTALGRPIG